jgi:competence ComEA-like helix-hairpin-helix protein
MSQPTLSFSRTRPVVVALLTFGFSLSLIGCVRRPNHQAAARTDSAALHQNELEKININTASAVVLEQLPGIGKGLAERIVDHRQNYGPFRRPEHLIIVRGISDKRFRALRDLITVE